MDVAVSELRAHLSEWLDRARAGDEVLVTERGVPVVRLVAVGATSTIERLTREGVIAAPEHAQRPIAKGRVRPTARRSVAAVVSEQRR
jgi:prevent-host-death family protein